MRYEFFEIFEHNIIQFVTKRLHNLFKLATLFFILIMRIDEASFLPIRKVYGLLTAQQAAQRQKLLRSDYKTRFL